MSPMQYRGTVRYSFPLPTGIGLDRDAAFEGLVEHSHRAPSVVRY
jgi:hypothetical protein